MLTIDKLTKTFASGSLAIGTSAATVLAGMGTISAPAQAAVFGCEESVSWSQLEGMSIQCGDKLFDNFRLFTSVASGGADAPTHDQVFFTAFETMPNWYSLIIQSPAWNVNPGQSIDTAFLYDVTVTDPTKWLTSVDLHLLSYGTTGDGTIHVTETVDLLNPGGSPVPLVVESAPGIDGVEAPLIPSQHKVTIAKDISLEGHTNGTASLSTLEQSYHQAPHVPEPSNVLGLLALGGLGLGMLRKKQK